MQKVTHKGALKVCCLKGFIYGPCTVKSITLHIMRPFEWRTSQRPEVNEDKAALFCILFLVVVFLKPWNKAWFFTFCRKMDMSATRCHCTQGNEPSHKRSRRPFQRFSVVTLDEDEHVKVDRMSTSWINIGSAHRRVGRKGETFATLKQINQKHLYWLDKHETALLLFLFFIFCFLSSTVP